MKLWLLVVALLLAVLVSVGMGSVAVPLADVIPALLGSADAKTSAIVVDIRMPRTLLAVLVGAGISASGAAIQGLFRNPLADPALIGVSAGAALFAALFVLIGGSAGFGLIGLAGSAFVGGLIATWIVLYVGSRAGGLSTMLLAGIAINAIALSGVGLLSYLSTDLQLRTISFWALGSLNGANWSAVGVALVIPLALALLLRESVHLNIITLGDEEAQHLGVSHDALRRRVIFLAAVIVGIGVALTGVIAFLGLVVPHLVRLSMGSRHQVVLPASALLGGLLLLVADTLARTVLAPAELPVGILTALVGGPFFIYLILREQKGRVLL
jgi:iron complex transport system permease protein